MIILAEARAGRLAPMGRAEPPGRLVRTARGTLDDGAGHAGRPIPLGPRRRGQDRVVRGARG